MSLIESYGGGIWVGLENICFLFVESELKKHAGAENRARIRVICSVLGACLSYWALFSVAELRTFSKISRKEKSSWKAAKNVRIFKFLDDQKGFENSTSRDNQGATPVDENKHSQGTTRTLPPRWHSVSLSHKFQRNLDNFSHFRRPGILVLVNDSDWELLGELDYEIQQNDNILFISTLHGGWFF